MTEGQTQEPSDSGFDELHDGIEESVGDWADDIPELGKRMFPDNPDSRKNNLSPEPSRTQSLVSTGTGPSNQSTSAHYRKPRTRRGRTSRVSPMYPESSGHALTSVITTTNLDRREKISNEVAPAEMADSEQPSPYPSRTDVANSLEPVKESSQDEAESPVSGDTRRRTRGRRKRSKSTSVDSATNLKGRLTSEDLKAHFKNEEVPAKWRTDSEQLR
ncbi:hypothetical protein M231_06484 [Tremella mesenterica]|uniref:Uncharacterized protein n=1 Tax=Tremella mesenterica TaxID=5217 RepID=A0A4V1M3B4_TREME|nr:hypothetical protein M231_06484 [Tremella mesenterica]